MMPEHLILIRHSSALRAVTEQEVLDTLDPRERGFAREVMSIDTTPFADDIATGDWERSSAYLRDRAAAVTALANADARATELRYFGLAEIPDVIAFGAFLGDERYVRATDYDRHGKEWRWPAVDQTLQLTTTPLPSERLTQPGIAVLRVSISALISDTDVEAAVGRESLADVTIQRVEGAPEVGLVRSAADVEHIRAIVRSALSAIRAARPGVEVIHLFVAAPVSACFVIGQELHLRSSAPVQTYRFRKIDGETAYVEAIRLSGGPAAALEAPLTEDERSRAAHARDVWKQALASVQAYAAARQKEPLDPRLWYETLRLGAPMSEARPFPALPPLWDVVDDRDTVDPSDFTGEGGYGHDNDTHCWRLADRLLLTLAKTAGDDKTVQRLIQLFLFHEYLHEHNALTKYTAREVGSYPNCLEHIDYAADLYALLHQLGWAMIYDAAVVRDDAAKCQFLADQIDLIIRSFWAFDEPFPRDEWQVRRVRRYLNWYWRHVQVKRAAPNLRATLAVLARRPAVELAGMRQRVAGRRIFASTVKRLPGEQLSLALVLEDERLMRVSNSVVTNLEELLAAFRTADHPAIQQFFNAVYEEARNWGGALPKAL